ncbi:LacI family DNA-binding transcriptional regulator [Sinomicrobium weinanense]|uniref:LacI family DNA-binding transcriptional regulator n=1 Tax=Sinomicrobium weinanense TaxID=2842200 RepID=A0A926JVL2_9FLAO|nr:LacI family DNA-binding transcriptional regulator [Sinomicrobium weinanense]MBC9798405.1 LacI family DNA-binding transcriptional regulator [Sinomicrobium weinanense]MBU3125102.1 LacI family transcriptional regulator [Sinomicrobium weinanense]
MKKKVTIKQIARELDVSVSTVSKALRDSKEISLDTRQKVQAFAKLLNYRPNNIAISLKNRKTKNIGVIIPEIVHHFFTTVISGIEREANKAGYNVIVCLSDESFDKEVINMETLANGSIDGFILSLSKETQAKKDFHHLQEAINQGMPLVMFDRIAEEIPCDKVVIDDVDGASKAVKYMMKTGCKRIALLSTVDYVSVGKLRTEGYVRALEESGGKVDESLILKIEDIDNCEKQIAELFDRAGFDGVFAVNELFAVTAMKEAQKRGYKIPEDISFMGFTDGILSKYAFPALTTVAQHGPEMGEMAAKMLIQRLESDEVDDESYVTEVIRTSITERESTKSN